MVNWQAIIVVGALAVFAFFIPSCKSREEPAATAPASRPVGARATSAKSPMGEYIRFVYAVYYLPEPENDPVKAAEEIAAQHFPTVKIVAELPTKPDSICLQCVLERNAKQNYAPPDLKSLGYFGRGLTKNQAESLQQSRQALILCFGYPKQDVWAGLRAANALVSRMARASGGLIWDEETREVFTPDAWDATRIATWTEEFPAVSDHTVIHAYQKDEYVRTISLGMAKFGLPDVVIESSSWSANRHMGHLLNLFAQALVEGAALPDSGEFDVNLRTIKNATIREPQVRTLKSNATAVARITLKKGQWEEGDPSNRLLEIGFDRSAEADLHARQDKVLGECFGWEDSPSPVKHTDELLAASQKAREKLPALREAFQKGLAPGEFIQLKAPFKIPAGGHEWMWVEVTSWEGNTIKGLLKNEPFNIPTLHGGQIVTVAQDEVFDYIRTHADGLMEGNETGTIIERQVAPK